MAIDKLITIRVADVLPPLEAPPVELQITDVPPPEPRPCVFDASHTAYARCFKHPRFADMLRALHCEQCNKAVCPSIGPGGAEGIVELNLQEWCPV